MTDKFSTVALTADDLPQGFLSRKGATRASRTTEEHAPRNLSVAVPEANDELPGVDPDELIWSTYQRLVFQGKFFILSPEHQAPFGAFFKVTSKYALALLKSCPSDVVESARSCALQEAASIRSVLDSLVEARYASKPTKLPRAKFTTKEEGARQFRKIALGLTGRERRRKDLAAVAPVKTSIAPRERGSDSSPDVTERTCLDSAPPRMESAPTFTIEPALAHDETQKFRPETPASAGLKMPHSDLERLVDPSGRSEFSVVHVTELREWVNGFPWLIQGIWQRGGVGIVGGPPKALKTHFVLDMSLAVAAGIPCLGRFVVPTAGPVILYLAEDAEQATLERVRGIASAKQVSLESIPLHFVRAPSIRLDAGPDLELLRKALHQYRPLLLVLDPLIRLHRGDENSATLISRLLGDLRVLSRECDAAIAIVHHLRKKRSGNQEGQNLRGSGDLHGWGDSNVYLVRDGRGRVRLSCEHRAAAGQPALIIEHRTDPAPHIIIAGEADEDANEPEEGGERDIGQEILNALAETGQPMTRDALRDKLGCRAEKVSAALNVLAESDQIARPSRRGWSLMDDASARK